MMYVCNIRSQWIIERKTAVEQTLMSITFVPWVRYIPLQSHACKELQLCTHSFTSDLLYKVVHRPRYIPTHVTLP